MDRRRRVDSAIRHETPNRLARRRIDRQHFMGIGTSDKDVSSNYDGRSHRTFDVGVFIPVGSNGTFGDGRPRQLDFPENPGAFGSFGRRRTASPGVVAIDGPIFGAGFKLSSGGSCLASLERELELVEVARRRIAAGTLRSQRTVAAQHGPTDTVLGCNVNQTISRYPSEVATAGRFGNAVRIDDAGAQVCQIEFSRKEITSRRHGREAVRQSRVERHFDVTGSEIDRRHLHRQSLLAGILPTM